MEALTEQIATARLRELEGLAQPGRPAVADAKRAYQSRRRALAWERLAGWASGRAEKAAAKAEI
ncbi:MAG: hypothetical protein GEU86_18000 [Actinophytocola sp.]|nr:hypothetical protein [Actinophytocola sp.]